MVIYNRHCKRRRELFQKFDRLHVTKLFPKRQILDSSKMKQLADDNFKFEEKDRKVFKRVENSVGKGEIALHKQFLFFPHCFLNTCTADT